MSSLVRSSAQTGRLQTDETVRALRRALAQPDAVAGRLRLQAAGTAQLLTRVVQQPVGAATAAATVGLLCRRTREEGSSGASCCGNDLTAAQKRWKRAGRAVKSFQIFSHDEFPGAYSSSEPVNLDDFEGLISSKLIAARASEINVLNRWEKLRANKTEAVGIQRDKSCLQGATISPPRSINEAVMTVSRVMKHSALVFDCADDHTLVYRLQYEPESRSVRAKVVGTCAGVGEILKRNAGSWFLKFASLTCDTQRKISKPEIAMVGTAAWYDSGSDGAETKRLHSAWKRIDGDQSGALDEHELRRALEDMGKSLSDEEFAKVWATIDIDQSGRVSFNEFMAWYQQQDHGSADTGSADQAKELVSSLTHRGLLCKRLGGSEQALFESLAVREVACRLGMTPRPQYFIGTGNTWVHCVALTSTEAPIVLCNDGVLGWADGVRRLDRSLDPLAELDAWLHDTVEAELDSVESRRVDSIGKLQGIIVLSGAAFEAAVATHIHSERDELKPVRAQDAVVKMRSVLTQLRQVMADGLLDFKTASSQSDKYREGQKVAMDLCNLTLHVELLRRIVHADSILFFKAKWAGISPPGATKLKLQRTLTRSNNVRMGTPVERVSEAYSERPSWVVGWYMHLLSTRFGVKFGEVEALIEHLDGLYAKAITLANLYDKEHAGSISSSGSSKAVENESVALTLVTMQDVVEALRSKARSHEPVATKALLALSSSIGGRMDGLDHKFKSVESLFRKLIQRLDRQLKANQHIPHCALTSLCN